MSQLCVHRDMKHLGSLESTQEARVALGYASSILLRIFRALQTPRVLHISMNARWRMNQWAFCSLPTGTSKTKKIQIYLDEVALFWMSQRAACPPACTMWPLAAKGPLLIDWSTFYPQDSDLGLILGVKTYHLHEWRRTKKTKESKQKIERA